MRLKFKNQDFQAQAVASVADCFLGQSPFGAANFSKASPFSSLGLDARPNAPFDLSLAHILKNLKSVQLRQRLPLSSELCFCRGCPVNLDVEMETGTGKTYCYVKTAFELYKRYAWGKFIVIVPSVAIREGVLKTLESTAEHFYGEYGQVAGFFAYDSRKLHLLDDFAKGGGVRFMVVNIQAFNASDKESRRIYEALDDFQSRRPIDVIGSLRPILILDEPQKIEGEKTLAAMALFRPLSILRYSATHRIRRDLVFRLDAIDAYNRGLVKKIAVRGVTAKGGSIGAPYVFLEAILTSKSAPVARVEIEARGGRQGVKKIVKTLGVKADLAALSGGLPQYRGFLVKEIDAALGRIFFENGTDIALGEAFGDRREEVLRRIQIREAVSAHLEKERYLFPLGVKALTLFFIDEVAKYRDYSQPCDLGEYAVAFEEEYERAKKLALSLLPPSEFRYREYLVRNSARASHRGYFSVDRKTHRLLDPAYRTRGERAGLSDDKEAFELILKDKERLLSFEEPVRFVFSHSALREGWDNPNVFVICLLKTGSTGAISRRQEVGRGLRLSVDQNGDRMDDPALAREVNVLTVVAGESYREFAEKLQTEMSESLAERPKKADLSLFLGEALDVNGRGLSREKALELMAALAGYGAIDETFRPNAGLLLAWENDPESRPKEFSGIWPALYALLSSVWTGEEAPGAFDDRAIRLDASLEKAQKLRFYDLMARAKGRKVFLVDFDSEELIKDSVAALNRELKISPLMFAVDEGLVDYASPKRLKEIYPRMGLLESEIEGEPKPLEVRPDLSSGAATYDILGELAERTNLTRMTAARILSAIDPAVFKGFSLNPEGFLAEAARIVKERVGSVFGVGLKIHLDSGVREYGLFAVGKRLLDYRLEFQEFVDMAAAFKKSPGSPEGLDYAFREISGDTENLNDDHSESSEKSAYPSAAAYFGLPLGFRLSTPIGDFKADWAMAFNEGRTRWAFFVAETKGNLKSLNFFPLEGESPDFFGRFFAAIMGGFPFKEATIGQRARYGELLGLLGENPIPPDPLFAEGESGVFKGRTSRKAD